MGSFGERLLSVYMLKILLTLRLICLRAKSPVVEYQHPVVTEQLGPSIHLHEEVPQVSYVVVMHLTIRSTSLQDCATN